jgi:intracellular sulfur oxidation DsrE/DsrF family protein
MRFVVSVLIACLLLSAFAGAGQVETDYFAVLMNNSKVGYSVHNRSVEGNLVTTTDQMHLTISRGGTVLNVTTSETYVETTEGKPLGFKTTEDLGIMNKTVEGKITPGGKLEVTTTQMGAAETKTMDYPAGALLSEGIRLLEIKKGLKAGTTYETIVFSPALLMPLDAKVAIGETENIDLFGRVVPLTKVEVVMNSPGFSLPSVSFVDSEHRPQKTVAPMLGMGLEIIACNRKFALSDNDLVDFLDRLLLDSPVEMKNIGSLSSATYYLKPRDKAELNIPTSPSQTIEQSRSGIIAVTVKPAVPKGGASLPYAGKNKLALDSLGPTGYLQSDNENVIALAKAAAGDAKDAAIAAKRIEAFVKGYISEKNLSVGYASAAEVALSRQGDCTEHAVLTAAMCRAMGIPARIVFGIAYADEFIGRIGVFGGHAWTEVFIVDEWIDLDATRAPKGFDVGHIRLASGNGRPGDFFEIISTLGYFTIEKVTLRQ